MEITTSLGELATVHPNLLWPQLTAACVAVLGPAEGAGHRLEIGLEGIPTFDDGRITLVIQTSGVDPTHTRAITRTFEPSRLVEMAAIVLAGLAVFHVAHLEIRDVALRGSRADYLVGERGYLMEVGGRSRRQDLAAAWREKWGGLIEREGGGFFLSLTEFETPAGRFAFHPPGSRTGGAA